MCGSMLRLSEEKEEERTTGWKYTWSVLLHRATINYCCNSRTGNLKLFQINSSSCGRVFLAAPSIHAVINRQISPVRDWWSTPLKCLSSTRDLDLDLGLGHTAYRRASRIELYLHINFIEIGKTFFVDGLSAGTPPSSRSRDTKTRINSKNPTRSEFRYCAVV